MNKISGTIPGVIWTMSSLVYVVQPFAVPDDGLACEILRIVWPETLTCPATDCLGNFRLRSARWQSCSTSTLE
jgi:hypothetical protein